MTVDTLADINYLTSTSDGLPPWLLSHSIPTTMRSNMAQAPTPMKIHDLRGSEASMDLDVNGFEIIKYQCSIQDQFEAGSEAQSKCYEEMIDLLRKRLGASRMLIFHHSFRSRNIKLPDDQLDETHRNPVYYPHVDFDLDAIRGIINRELGKEEGERLQQKRFQLINLWRPIGDDPIRNKPLTICDYQSVDVDKDIRPLLIHSIRQNYSSYALARNDKDAHQWYYLSNMRSDEIFMFKIGDTRTDVAQYAFHTAFDIKDAPMVNDKQRSLELRCLVFYDE